MGRRDNFNTNFTILEAIVKKKIIIFLEHLIPKSYGKWHKDFKNSIYLTKKNDDLVNFLNSKYLEVKKTAKYRKITIGSNNKHILKKYLNFYKAL